MGPSISVCKKHLFPMLQTQAPMVNVIQVAQFIMQPRFTARSGRFPRNFRVTAQSRFSLGGQHGHPIPATTLLLSGFHT